MPHAMPAHAETFRPLPDDARDGRNPSAARLAGSAAADAEMPWGDSEPMKLLRRALERVAPTQANVLLVGESGTGKTLAAQYLHRMSGAPELPFVAIACDPMAGEPLEAGLFGGAADGVLRRAAGGTVFLDDVTCLPGALQSKLLHELDADPAHRPWRMVAATSRDPAEAVADGSLRPDLLYRLAEFPLRVPPLRERGTDIERLAERFVDALNDERRQHKRLSVESRLFLYQHDWPGNVRELKNAVDRAWLLAERELALSHVDLRARSRAEDRVEVPIGTSIADMERALITATLARCEGNKRQAAVVLGVSLKTLYNRLHQYGRFERAIPARPDMDTRHTA